MFALLLFGSFCPEVGKIEPQVIQIIQSREYGLCQFSAYLLFLIFPPRKIKEQCNEKYIFCRPVTLVNES